MKKILATTMIALAGAVSLTGCDQLDTSDMNSSFIDHVMKPGADTNPDGTPAGVGQNPAERGVNYYDSLGQATFDDTCNIAEGDYNYTGLINSAGQVGPACAIINRTSLAERVNPKDDPAGYKGNNGKETIPTIAGDSNYNGYFYNRSHMISAGLGGSPYEENLVTGTRMQNVGESNKGGMRYTETIAEDYIKSGKAETCALTYEVTPHYNNDTDKVPTWVEVNMKNCDGSINEKVATYNDANGFTIDYATGAYTKN